ncbi:MAG: pyruvate kinase [Clostridiales bacterium]|nr:MAG: pyruvate kinase [Clostridiales bacterium]
MRKTKIVCTIGPATNTEEKIRELINAGMNVARFNFSHGTHESHKKTMDLLKKVRKEMGKPIGILLDTKGPDIRIGKVKENTVLVPGKEFILTGDKKFIEGDEKKVYISYKKLYKDVSEGDVLLIDDGLIKIVVKEIVDKEIVTVVEVGGPLSTNKGINAPGIKINLPAITKQDIADIKFGVEQEVDFIAASFVRRKSDIIKIKGILEEENCHDISLIAKIESRQGYENIDKIISVSDGIMVARGDLGVEMPIEEIPVAQKTIIRKCNTRAKFVITATQMLDSMIRNPSPTRAEVTDVANAILDGTDAIMLSGETAAGKYPIESVEYMHKIATLIEDSEDYEDIMGEIVNTDTHDKLTYSISRSTAEMARKLEAAAIVTITSSGFTARRIAMHRPGCPIFAITTSEKNRRRLNLFSGVYTYIMDYRGSMDQVFKKMVSFPLHDNLLQIGDLVVITCGVPFGVIGTTNTMKVHIVGEFIYKGVGIGKKEYRGKVKLITDEFDLDNEKGYVLYADSLSPDDYNKVANAGALITEVKGYSSRAAKWAKEFGIPAIVGVKYISEKIQSGMEVTVDPRVSVVHNARISINK